MSHAGLWPRIHPAVQSAAASSQPRHAARTHEKSTVPLQYLWKRLRDRELSEDPYVKSNLILIHTIVVLLKFMSSQPSTVSCFYGIFLQMF